MWGGSDVCQSVESGVRSSGAGAEETLELSLPPPRPPPGSLPAGSRRGSVAAVLWRAARRGPGLQSGRIFHRPPSPPARNPSGRQTKVPVAAAGGGGAGASASAAAGPAALLPYLSPGPAGFGGEPGRGLRTRRRLRSPPRKVGHF